MKFDFPTSSKRLLYNALLICLKILLFIHSGTSTDVAACFRKKDGYKVDDILCEASLKPAIGEPKECVLEKCPETYSWNVTYGVCSVTCGEGQY